MSVAAPVRPRRSLAFPFVVASYPLLWLVARETSVSRLGRPITDALPQVIGLTAVAVAVSYAVAVVVAVLVPDPDSASRWARAILDPSNATLALVGGITVALVAYFSASSIGIGFPPWLAPVERSVGLFLGWPLMISIVVLSFVANTYPTLGISYTAQLLVVTLGIAFTAAWLFLLASGVATIARSVSFATPR